MSGKKSFVLGALLLALPNIIQNLITNLAALVDNLMVGGLQEHAIAGVTVVNQVVFIFTIVMFGIGGTAGIFIPQYKGIGNEQKMTEVFKISLVLSLVFGIVFFVIMGVIPEVILSFFARDAETISEALSYLQFIRYTLLVLPISFAIGSAFRFCGHVKIPMYLAIVIVAISTFLNVGLIHGHFGMPAMGVQGAALGTLVARLVEMVILVLLTRYVLSPVKISFRRFFKLEGVMFKSFIQKGYGLILNEFFWVFGMQTLAVIYTMRISENIAAMSISSTFAKLIWVGMGGMSVVFSIYLGEHLGRDDFDGARRDARRLKFLSACLGLVLASMVLLLSTVLIGLYDVDPEVMRTGRLLLMVSVSFSWLYYLNSSYYFILRSGGDTKGVLLIDSAFTWVIMIPVAFALRGFGLFMPVHFLLVQSLEFVKHGIAYRLYKKGSWLNNLTIVEEKGEVDIDEATDQMVY